VPVVDPVVPDTAAAVVEFVVSTVVLLKTELMLARPDPPSLPGRRPQRGFATRASP
jgi:hypothetical protein